MDKKKAQKLQTLASSLLPAKGQDILELDELWSFVYSKENQQWVWLALCRRTRQIVSWAVGPRDWWRCHQLKERIPQEYLKCRSYSDHWHTYDQVFEYNISVGKEKGQTAHIERFNNTLRQKLGRFIRKTLSFSKTQEMHEATLKLFLYNYNLAIKSAWE